MSAVVSSSLSPRVARATVDDGPPSITIIGNDGWWIYRVLTTLQGAGFHASIDTTGDAAFTEQGARSDAAIVALDLTHRSGSAVCAAWRARWTSPILAVAPDRDETVVLAAFAAGADHVVSADITDRLLLARLGSLLRRSPRRADVVGPDGVPDDIVVDDSGRFALVQGTEVALTQLEVDFLRLLLRRAGRVVMRTELQDLTDRTHGTSSVDTTVRRLRRKLAAADPRRRITAVRGVGFRLDVIADADVVADVTDEVSS